LEDRRSKDDKTFRGVWKAVETKAGKIGMAKTKGGRSERRSRKEIRREEREKAEKETKERKNDRGEKSSRRIGDLG